ncbi:MAG: FAD-dependent oxidoreductase, partial [Sneathiella sp.]
YRHVLDIPTENKFELRRIESEGGLLRLHLEASGKSFAVLTRRLVLATGRAAFGGARLPSAFKNLPNTAYAHTEDAIDFGRLKDKRVIVIGGAASAVDAAAEALETGAKEVHLLMRARTIPRLNKFKSSVYPGFFRGFNYLNDETRWRFLQHGFATKIAAPRASMLRLKAFENFHLHLGCPVEAARSRDEKVELTTPNGTYEADFVILGTGYAINIVDQQEFSAFADQVLLWQDRYRPPEDIEYPELGRFPYLGAGFELLEKQPGSAPFLSQIHLFNAATTMTHAAVSSDIPGVNIGAERLINALVVKFFNDAKSEHLADFYEYSDPELLGDEWNET